jgi:hypothetical protein
VERERSKVLSLSRFHANSVAGTTNYKNRQAVAFLLHPREYERPYKCRFLC